MAGRVGDRAQRVGQPEAEQRLEALAGLRAEQRVVDPGGGIMDVRRRRNDVEVAGQHQRLFRLKPLPSNTQEVATSI